MLANTQVISDLAICRGIDNKNREYRIPIGSRGDYYLLEAKNIDILNRGSIRKRGQATQVSIGNISSLYSFRGLLYLVDGNTLKSTNGQTFENIFNSLVPPVKFTDNGKTLFFMDKQYVYEYNLTSVRNLSLVTHTEDFFISPKRGQCIAYNWGRLIIANGNKVQLTVPYKYDTVDTRNGFFYLPSYVKDMCKLSREALLISDLTSTYIVKAGSEGFVIDKVLSMPAYTGSFRPINASLINQKLTGEVVLFVSEAGLHLALSSGEVMLLSDVYAYTEGSQATLLNSGDKLQYIYI